MVRFPLALAVEDMPIVAVDLETTGLDVVQDRIVQIGAVRVDDGRLDGHHALDLLINPGLAIPRQSSLIHGISDADVADAPPVGDGLAALMRYADGRIIIGHQIGFDLTIIKNEFARCDQPRWQPPDWLDLVHIGARLRGFPDLSLDAMAGRLDIHISSRHTGLGDARAAGEIWCGLLPRLQAKGIKTYGELRALARGARGVLRQQRRAGWITDMP